ncbi:MAG: hypothetical protein WAL71_10780 [Terriglobales bacterium]|jgi:hypothetical protein
MKRVVLFTFLLPVLYAGLSFSQQAGKHTVPEGVFAYAINARRLIAVDKDLEESNARLLAKAVCPTHAITSAVSLSAIGKAGNGATPGFQYESESDVPAGSYCLLVDPKAHEKLFVWGSADSPLLMREKKCPEDIAKQAEGLTGRKVASCDLIGSYGTGKVELVEYAHESPADRLAALMVIDHSMADGPRYSIARFPAGSSVWTAETDGTFHPERFRYLFTVSDDPDSELWSVAIEWAGPAGHDLTLYQPVGSELKPLILTHDSSRHEKSAAADIALK